LLAYSYGMKSNYIIISILSLAIVITGVGLYVWQQQSSAESQQSTSSAEMSVSPTPTKTAAQEKPSASETAEAVSQKVSLYHVAIGDTQAGPEIGCGDSLVGVTKQLTTVRPLTDSIKALLALDDEYYGESGLYNALWQSNLRLDSASISNGVATIALSGDLRLGGTCDSPRVKAQLEATATQFASVNSVTITVNGQPLDQALSTK
jgi:spore germination protein GerM